MRNRKVFHLLALFSETDRQRFSLFLDSPYCNPSPLLRAFWAQWQLKVFSLADSENLTEEGFVAGSTIKVNRIDRLCTQLNQKAKQFLAMEDFLENRQLQPAVLSQAILNRDPAMNSWQRFVPQLQKQLEQEPESPERLLALLYLKSGITQAKVLARSDASNWLDDFIEMQQILNGFWLSKGAQLGCGAVNISKIFKQEFRPEAQLALLPQRENEPWNNHGLLPGLYKRTLDLLEGGPDEVVFPELMGLLKENRDAIAEHTRNDLYGYLLNHCIRQINLGNEPFLEHTFLLYNQLIQNGDLLQQGRISPQEFKNLTALACRLDKLEWAEAFWQKFKDQLLDGHNGMAVQYNRAVLLFHQNRFSEALGHFKSIIQEPRHDVFYGLDARMYLWKSYFERLSELNSSELDDMYKLYDAFRIYVDRNERISSLHQLQYRNFVRLFKKFMQLLEKPRSQKQKGDLKAFQDLLATSKDVANKSWFTKKVREKITDSGN